MSTAVPGPTTLPHAEERLCPHYEGGCRCAERADMAAEAIERAHALERAAAEFAATVRGGVDRIRALTGADPAAERILSDIERATREFELGPPGSDA